MVQHTVDWDARYRAGDTPWEDEAVAPSVTELVLAHPRPGAHVLEIGCGYGTNMAQQGYRVTACDVSSSAVRVVGERASGLRRGFPRLSASELVAAVEPHFEVESIHRVSYGVSPGRTDFLAWASSRRRRS